MQLEQLEIIAWKGVQYRMQELQNEQRAIIAVLSERLGLPPDAIGKTHGLDQSTWRIVPVLHEDK